MVEISVAGTLQFQRVMADVVKSLVVDDVTLVSVLYQLMERESSVVWLDNSLGDLERVIIKFVGVS